jgi:SAM-dependent methyltransferase
MTARRCPACDEPLAPYLPEVRDPQSGERFSVLRCEVCGLGATEPAPLDLARYYGRAYYGGRHSFTARYRAWRRIRLLRRQAPRPGRLLDVGCGEGHFVAAAAASGWSVVGTEKRADVPHARRLGIEVHDSLDELVAGGGFDVVTLWHSFEHLPDPIGELARAAELLGAGGLLIVAVPDFGGFQAATFGRRWFHLDVPRHLFHFTQASLRTLLEKRGLEIERIDHHEIEYDLFGWLQSTLNALLPTQNLFFDWLTGRAVRGRGVELATSVVLSVVLGPLAVLATVLASLAGRGSTLVVVARRPIGWLPPADAPGP